MRRHRHTALWALRTYFGLTQPELARYLGIERTLLAHAEADRRALPLDAAWRLLPLLHLLPPEGSDAAGPPPPDPAETTAATLDQLQWRLKECRYLATRLAHVLERQLPKLHAARHRRALPTLLAALPPQAPLPGLASADGFTPDPRWPEKMAAGAAADLARFGQQARALLEARRAGLLAEIAALETALGLPPG